MRARSQGGKREGWYGPRSHTVAGRMGELRGAKAVKERRAMNRRAAVADPMKTIDMACPLSSSEKGLLRELKRLVRRLAPGARLFLYGSAARGDREPDSDYDVLVLLERQLGREHVEKIRDAIYDLELDRGVVISPVIVSRDEWNSPRTAATPYHRAVTKEAIQL